MRFITIICIVTMTAVCGLGCNFIRTDNLNQAIARGDIQDVQRRLDKGIGVNGTGMHAVTPLMKAAAVGRLDICELLIKHGADVNGHNDTGSVLVFAVGSGNEELVRFLLKSGANKAWKNVLGEDALWLATILGYTNIIEILKADDPVE